MTAEHEGGVLDGAGLREPPSNKALLRFCCSDHEGKPSPNGALTQPPRLTTEKTNHLHNELEAGKGRERCGGSAVMLQNK